MKFDLFLSHNSADKLLVEGVAELLLEESGLQCWIDIWSIPAASDWEREIMKAVTTCRATVIFYGPNGWGPWHGREALLALEYAAENPGYRVIPVRLSGLVGAVPSPDIDPHGTLSDLYLNRHAITYEIQCSDFAEQIKSALGAVPPHPMGRARMTPYVIRRDARRWAAPTQNKGARHPSQLYRGRQLEQALPVSSEHPGQLDALAMEFLQASIARRKTLAWRWVAGCLVVMCAIALLAYREATARGIATSRLYATLAEGEFNRRHLGTSALLATAAWKEAPTDTARIRVLGTAAAFPHLKAVLLERSADDLSGGWSAMSGSEKLFVLSSDRLIRLWDTGSGNDAPRQTTLETGPALGPVSITADGRLAAVADSKLQVWPHPLADATDHSFVGDLLLSTAGLVALQGGKLAAVDHEGRLRVIHLDSGTVSEPIAGAAAASPWTRLAAIAGTDSFVIANDQGRIQIFSTAPELTSRARAELPGEGPIDLVVASPELHSIVAKRAGQPAQHSTVPFNEWTEMGGDITAAQHLSDGRLLVGYADGTLKLWPSDADQSQPPLLNLRGHHGAVVTIGTAGSMVISSDAEGTALLWDLNAHALRQTIWRAEGGAVTSLCWSGDGRSLAAATSGGVGIFWSPVTAAETPWTQSMQAGFVILDKCGRQLLTCTKDGVLTCWQLQGRTWASGRPIAAGKEITAMAASASMVVLGTKQGELMAWHVSTKSLRPVAGTPFTAHTRAVRSLTFAQNGRLLGSGSADGAVKMWDAMKLSEASQISGTSRGNGRANFLKLHPEGESYLVGGATNILEHWQRKAPEPRLHARLQQQNGIGAFTADPEMEFAVTTDMFTQVTTLWHIPSSQQALSLGDLGGVVEAVAYSPTHPLIAIGTGDGRVMLVDLDPGQATKHLLRMANRNLSPREWTQFMGNKTYRRFNAKLPPGEDRAKSYD